jgi:hypothetical protein
MADKYPLVLYTNEIKELQSGDNIIGFTLNVATSATGTLPVANGGTGASSLTANNVILGNGTSAVSFVAPGSNGNVLTSNGTTWVSSAGGGASTSKAIVMAYIFG